MLYCALQVDCHKEIDSVHLVIYQVNQLSLGLYVLQRYYKMTAVCLLVTLPTCKAQYQTCFS